MKQSFAAGEVVRLTGLPYSTLQDWDRSGFLSPSVQAAAGTGSDRLWSLADVVAAHVIGHNAPGGRTPRAVFRPLIGFLQHCAEPWPAYVIWRAGEACGADTAEEAAAIAARVGTCWVAHLGAAREHVLGMEVLGR